MVSIKEIKVRGYRCFAEEQCARIGRLTLLVGENSTGKSSFLALIRAIWNAEYRGRIPNFNEEPFDLGSFEEIAYRSDKSGHQCDHFEAEMTDSNSRSTRITFGKQGTAPVPMKRHVWKGMTWIRESRQSEHEQANWTVGTETGVWKRNPEALMGPPAEDSTSELQWPTNFAMFDLARVNGPPGKRDFLPQPDAPAMGHADAEAIRHLIGVPHMYLMENEPPFAFAPIRSRPQRTFDPVRVKKQPEGDHIPHELAELARDKPTDWKVLRRRLQEFGHGAGLFEDIRIEHLGDRLGAPFQIEVKLTNDNSDDWRNLVDVGYGVCQVLPVITELMHSESRRLCLIQQPEVHLHPRAQATLASHVCRTVQRRPGPLVDGGGRQFLIETHSSYIMDRVRMEIRDRRWDLPPEDVSILFFERSGPAVQIHSIEMDREGNVVGAPKNYRKFFMDELKKSLGYR